jgi:cyclophilin family peptidyl-prolyl cis-trans isomerase
VVNPNKRQRQKANTRAAREARQSAEKKTRRNKAIIRFVIAAAIVAGIAGLVAIFNDDSGDNAASDATSTTVPETTTSTVPPTTALPTLVPTECNDDTPDPVADRPTYDAPPAMTIDSAKTYTATITTSCGDIVVELDAASAPVATNNFVFLAREGFYDGLTWHRVVPDFVVQGGDPAGDGTGGPGYSVEGEPPTDGYQYGSIAAAKGGGDPAGTMGSQFFIVTGPNGTTLPNDYARFGVVTEGFDVARTLESFATGDAPPSRSLYIFKVEITES